MGNAKSSTHLIVFWDADTNPPTTTDVYLCFTKKGYGMYRYDANEHEWQYWDPEWDWISMDPDYVISWSDVETDGTVCWDNPHMNPKERE